MTTKRTLAAALAVAALTLSGCTSGSADNPAASDKETAGATSEPTREVTPEPTVSPARIPFLGKDGTPTRSADKVDTKVIGASGRWAVDTRYNIDGALGIELGKKADAFLREHYLRADRWKGKTYVKEGEMDAFKEKVAPELHSTVTDALTSIEDKYAKYGTDSTKWSKKEQSDFNVPVLDLASLFMNDKPSDDGEGDLIFRIRDRTVFRGTAENNWEGDLIGVPITYVYADASHKTGSAGPETFFLWQAWKKVKGEWVVFAASRSAAS